MTRDDAGSLSGDERVLVWVSGWQFQCCGDPFAVGSRVEWTLAELSDRDWLTALLGDELARAVTHREEHHGGLPDDVAPTVGRVARIRTVSSSTRPGSTGAQARIVDVPDADGWVAEDGGLRFDGYLVDLRQTEN